MFTACLSFSLAKDRARASDLNDYAYGVQGRLVFPTNPRSARLCINATRSAKKIQHKDRTLTSLPATPADNKLQIFVYTSDGFYLQRNKCLMEKPYAS